MSKFISGLKNGDVTEAEGTFIPIFSLVRKDSNCSLAVLGWSIRWIGDSTKYFIADC